MSPANPRAGQNVTLTCRSSPSNPPSKITWWHAGERLDGAAETVVELVEGDGGSLQDGSSGKGGAVTESAVTLAVTARHDAAVVTCEAANGADGGGAGGGGSKSVGRAHDAVTLSVHREWQQDVKVPP